MKRRNISKTILERGGLMIEALSMLGLIAIVTPTMYKKSAERTMEVEDINTASTIRTIMNAANDYVGANYSTIISDMGETQQTRPITADQLRQYLPYKFNVERALFNYGNPEITIVKQGNNLTTFALFPAQADIGQERTSRIASLVGASGGYVTESGTARGIGGIWKLDGDDYSNAFPTSGNGAQQYSIVTASADTINAATGNEIDMDKYLQRGKDASDDPNDRTTWWKNTMRTDLYMGNVDNANDVYNNNASTDTFSIRNIRSLIVGAENSGDDNDEYGLYIAEGGGKPNAFVGGSLSAAQQLFVGRDADSGDFHFNVDANGNTLADGSLTNLMDVNLASKLNDAGTGPAWSEVKIGSLSDDSALIKGKTDMVGGYWMKPAKPGKLYIMENGWNSFMVPSGRSYGPRAPSITAEEPSYANSAPFFPVKIEANTHVKGLLNAYWLDTDNLRTASLSVGSENIDDYHKWLTANKDGVTIQQTGDGYARVSNSTRAHFEKDEITLGVGTDGSDDSRNAGLVLQNSTTDADGNTTVAKAQLTANNVEVTGDTTTVTGNEKVKVVGNNAQVIGKDKLTASSKSALIQALNTTDFGTSEDFTNDLAENTLVLRNSNMQATMKDKQLTIEGRTSTDSDVRTLFNNGSVDLNNTNLNIRTNYKDHSAEKMVFSVRTNETPGDAAYKNTYASDPKPSDKAGYKIGYDITMHGNILIGNEATGEHALRISSNPYTQYYASIGEYNENAAININPVITGGTYATGKGNRFTNIIYVDQGATDNDNKLKVSDSENSDVKSYENGNTDPGTIYIRKGYVEVRADNYDASKKLVADEGKGVIVASRFVANNPADATNSTKYGAKFGQIVNKTKFDTFNGKNNTAYDTYMVNPAYTSVMHDIKLTTRGGARLSDVLPDFINKGIYVVNNTISEEKVGNAKVENAKGENEKFEFDKDGNLYSDVKKIDEDIGKDSLDMSLQSSWASPFMGVVPAPQCPPGYGRVITLTPASFEMGQAGLLRNSKVAERYYITPNAPSDGQAKAAAENAPSFERAKIEGGLTATGVTSDGKAVNVNISKGNTSNGSLQTESYVLQYKTDVAPNTPLMFQQSTRLKSLVTELRSGFLLTKEGEKPKKYYTQGWAAIMGFLYPGKMYTAFGTSNDNALYWNVFPVIRGTLEAYATVYCYFDRTNLYGGYDHYSDDFIDKYTYMQNMEGKSTPQKEDSNYTNRLNDPALKYNEVW